MADDDISNEVWKQIDKEAESPFMHAVFIAPEAVDPYLSIIEVRGTNDITETAQHRFVPMLAHLSPSPINIDINTSLDGGHDHGGGTTSTQDGHDHEISDESNHDHDVIFTLEFATMQAGDIVLCVKNPVTIVGVVKGDITLADKDLP